MKFTLLRGASISFVGAVALWSCGGKSSPAGPSNPNPPPAAQTVVVSIVGSSGNGAFKPNPVAAATGDTVIFRNNDSAVHRIVLDDGSADLGTLTPGSTSRGFTVRSATAAKFHCTNHTSMVGSINGDSAPEPPPCPDPSGYGC